MKNLVVEDLKVFDVRENLDLIKENNIILEFNDYFNEISYSKGRNVVEIKKYKRNKKSNKLLEIVLIDLENNKIIESNFENKSVNYFECEVYEIYYKNIKIIKL